MEVIPVSRTQDIICAARVQLMENKVKIDRLWLILKGKHILHYSKVIIIIFLAERNTDLTVTHQ